MARMWHARCGAEARAGREGKARRLRDLGERERVELRRHLAQGPGAIVPFGMLLRPSSVAAMVRGVRFATLRISSMDEQRKWNNSIRGHREIQIESSSCG